MAEPRMTIDITNLPELRRVVERAQRSNEPIILRFGDRPVAKITLLRPEKRGPLRERTQQDYEEFLSTFGAWQGDIDIDRLKADLKAARGSDRPPVDL